MDLFCFHWQMVENMQRFKERTDQMVHPYCERYAITSQQLRILITLHYSGPQTVTALAKRTCMAGANNSAACKKLEGLGYVTRRRDEQDERLVVVRLTGEGTRLVEDINNSCKQYYGAMSDRLTPQDTEAIAAGFDRLFAIMETKENTNE